MYRTRLRWTDEANVLSVHQNLYLHLVKMLQPHLLHQKTLSLAKRLYHNIVSRRHPKKVSVVPQRLSIIRKLNLRRVRPRSTIASPT